MINVLYEDAYLIICIKPVGIHSQPSNQNALDMVTLLSQYRKNKNESDYIGVVHRLDVGVGGVMVFAKTKEIAGKLSAAISDRIFTKEYLAIVCGCPSEKKGTYEDLLFKDSTKNKSFVAKRMRKGVKEASLDYEVKESIVYEEKTLSIVQIHLNTGRTHQIRVQFSSRRMPLLGDGKYGSSNNHCSIALWSYRLAFKHPATKKMMDVIKLPENVFPWSLFPSCLND